MTSKKSRKRNGKLRKDEYIETNFFTGERRIRRERKKQPFSIFKW